MIRRLINNPSTIPVIVLGEGAWLVIRPCGARTSSFRALTSASETPARSSGSSPRSRHTVLVVISRNNRLDSNMSASDT